MLALSLSDEGLLRLLGILLPCLDLGPFGLEDGFDWPQVSVTDGDVRAWPFSVGFLVKIVAFLGSLHWPTEVADLGSDGVSIIELLILSERWAGERLVPEKSLPKFRRPDRPISVSAAAGGPGVDIWKWCQYLASMIRALRTLPDGLGRFIPCRICGHQGRLRHIG